VAVVDPRRCRYCDVHRRACVPRGCSFNPCCLPPVSSQLTSFNAIYDDASILLRRRYSCTEGIVIHNLTMSMPSCDRAISSSRALSTVIPRMKPPFRSMVVDHHYSHCIGTLRLIDPTTKKPNSTSSRRPEASSVA
jgi:hypothetical protein